MNVNIPIIFEEVAQTTFQPAAVGGSNSEWIQNFNLTNFGNGGEIVSINVDAVGNPGTAHGIERFSFWIARYDFTPLITSPRTLYHGNRGPSTSDIMFWSGDISAGSTIALDTNHSLYNESFIYPVPYLTGGNLQLAFTTKGIATTTTIKFTIRGRRTQ